MTRKFGMCILIAPGLELVLVVLFKRSSSTFIAHTRLLDMTMQHCFP